MTTLAQALEHSDTRAEATEALRGLIDSIVLTPEKDQLRIELRGQLAAMLAAAEESKRSPETGDLLVPIQMVAEACSHRYLEPMERSRMNHKCDVVRNAPPDVGRERRNHG